MVKKQELRPVAGRRPAAPCEGRPGPSPTAHSGRAGITHEARDLGRFKIGPLRNIALTAPYMHNGMFRTLREVIEYYNDPDKGVPHPINRDSLLSKPLGLSAAEIADLEEFLRSLTSRRLMAAAR